MVSALPTISHEQPLLACDLGTFGVCIWHFTSARFGSRIFCELATKEPTP